MNLNAPFIGSEALRAGAVRKHQLRSNFQAILPNVYVPKGSALGLADKARAAWLWSHRQGVIAGLTASGLQGSEWVDESLPIELIWPNARAPHGVRTYDLHLEEGECVMRGGVPITSLGRTAFDIGRWGRLDDAVARLDALGNATLLQIEDILRVAELHPGARGVRQLSSALDLYDPGAQSPKETWLRLLIIRQGYPRPTTQIPVRSPDGRRQYYLDMGWEERKLAVEYDGDHHRKDPKQFAHDIIRSEDLDELGWTRVRAAKRHSTADVLRRLSRAWESSLRTDRKIS
ncbi:MULTISPECIES: endonuclease domain-containing protein [unclassified Mycolicibacterium]|uniref:endonuclease domain-containing protein n=1 Tax=unclassified Mycolicibacterium TaxID=2636767 RepID=UPI0012DF6E0D|nr:MULTISPECIES: hypothetical protein [unclassified Mycolicibacterium]MUL85159.1 hypothetical protein [Mycolicibacterium sp. CBMA 329]MUL91126.1 hypothetical protein [Mycolicibacterium sp. CBMA 331]MUL98204.1 hypothetical protein [Mycolicibacterium sp. CBMA 334]MUM26087.1 hypothetical protein [Mycolicibacterium sp. CBMA 295]MUM40885.1 hypothetical protein [Mycolicibacterium sp. CBMA 247]